MNKYKVPVKLIFTGTVDVLAEDEEKAKNIVSTNFSGMLAYAENNCCDSIEEWDIDIHGDTELNEDEEVELIGAVIDEEELSDE